MDAGVDDAGVCAATKDIIEFKKNRILVLSFASKAQNSPTMIETFFSAGKKASKFSFLLAKFTRTHVQIDNED